MAKRSSYERRGNATARSVREKAGAHKPITRREMRAAFEAWKAGKGDGCEAAHREKTQGVVKTRMKPAQ
jgi:hypothetical protein